jgi:hypothetical protein
LTRNPQNGHITLRYESRTRNVNEELSGQTLETLMSALSRSGEFSQDAINIVRTQAALMPAVRLSPSEQGDIKEILAIFYLNPNTGTYNAVRDVHAVYSILRVSSGDNNAMYAHVASSYINAVSVLNNALGSRMISDVRNNPRVISGANSVEAIARQLGLR